ncbi:alpha/beta hydrolase-fold protein [Rhizobium sp. ICMP 5592]|uniref:alpha/beta hydrolase n=1 Tax=Rhizobium sp. ICMP 5592 TaxID=2292445 RepID=UPI0012952324|nr:alpha/beta hydrolase-fold protein [Rhizobium sp. ICMP 5592]MQB46023.1 esterase family protein [Rhizobium sp. ICMP 5592]
MSETKAIDFSFLKLDDSAKGRSLQDQAEYARSCSGEEPYAPGPESLPVPENPAGAVTEHEWTSRIAYPGVSRRYRVYVPKQYDSSVPANLMVFQDGEQYLREVRCDTVFDNLIAKGHIPPTIGLFVEPGNPGPGYPVYGGEGNRSIEYDSITSDYADFLATELIPEIKKELNITDDPRRRAICGISSGGMCAFNAAWHRPLDFGNVISHCGSFVHLRGGFLYPTLVRRTERKPIRVYLQTGSKDLNIILGDLVLANRELASALAYRAYDMKFVFGEGGHTLMHASALFPDTMRWTFGDKPVRTQLPNAAES